MNLILFADILAGLVAAWFTYVTIYLGRRGLLRHMKTSAFVVGLVAWVWIATRVIG